MALRPLLGESSPEHLCVDETGRREVTFCMDLSFIVTLVTLGSVTLHVILEMDGADVFLKDKV